MAKNIPRQPQSDEAIELVAARFRALAEPSRLKLIMAVEHGEKNVSQLVAATGMSQPNVSRHLQTLTYAGILTRRKERMSVFTPSLIQPFAASINKSLAACRSD
jgi:ArsR family transcriptional regulator